MIDTLNYALGGSWFHTETNCFHTHCLNMGYREFKDYQRGFRCVYRVKTTPNPARVSIKGGTFLHRKTGALQTHARIGNLFSIRSWALGFRCVYLVKTND